MESFRFILEYDGTDFAGWQAQGEGRRTVQASVADALARIVGGPVRLTGSGRTDAGVHAAGQVASARFETRLDAGSLREALNANLPGDVAVVAVERVADDFDARRHARSKHYRYRIWNDSVRSPLRARRSWWVRTPLDVEAMQKAARHVVGEHDFAAFQAAGSSVRTTVRRLDRVEVVGRAPGEIVLDFEGPGFLRYMVRNLVGTLAEVGRGRRPPEDMARVLASRDRACAGVTAPARGLTLVAVRYADPEVRCGRPSGGFREEEGGGR